MDKYPKLFLKAGLFYLALGVSAGVLVAMESIDGNVYKFVHLHLNLVGFMLMTIFGVAYHILPRFNGRPLPNPGWLPIQFYLMNAGLLGMLVFYAMGGYWEAGLEAYFFWAFSMATATAIFLFILNIFPVLQNPPPIVAPSTAASRSAVGPAGGPKITGAMKVAAVLDTWPAITPIFIEHGFKALANPVAKAAFAKMITISGACKIHHVNEEKFLAALNDFVKGSDKASPAEQKLKPPVSPAASKDKGTPSPAGSGKEIKKGERCTPEVLVGKLIEVYPETKKVFEKHYGAACFSCPGQAFETIAQTASMHNASLDMILGEINVEIDKVLDDK